MNKQSTFVWVTTSFEGIHQYPGAKDLPGVEFLAYPHRHIFHVKLTIEVFDNDREIEFILLKRWLDSMCTDYQLNNRSCEQIAEEIRRAVENQYGSHRRIEVSVSEDNENGAILSTIV